MKLQSELYLYELTSILHGLSLQSQQIVDSLKRRRRVANVCAFLMPWARREIYTDLCSYADASLKEVTMLSELRDKILDARDSDSITFQQIIEKRSGGE